MIQICPAILATDTHTFREEMQRVADFATRLQVDLMDKDFTGQQSIASEQVWWGEGQQVDLHVMYQNPSDDLVTLIALNPRMIILHAESDGDLKELLKEVSSMGIKTGIALLPETSVESAKELIELVDHVLIFAGHLGHHGGEADLSQLDKVSLIRSISPDIEIGWDGGINASNAKALIEGGIDVLNVGGYLQKAENPQENYNTLSSIR